MAVGQRTRTGVCRIAGTAMAATALLAGCSAATPHGHAARRVPAARSSAPLSAARLAGGLLPGYATWGAITPSLKGSFGSLPTVDVGDVPQPASGVRFSPANCAPAMWSGPRGSDFSRSPAAVVALRVPGDHSGAGVQVWDELIAVTGRPAGQALGTGPRAGCSTVRATRAHHTLTFRELPVPRLGAGSRGAVVDVHPSGSRRTQVMAFVTKRYVGVTLAQGPVSTPRLARFTQAFYANARKKLG